jgi:hypothetical protein
MNLRNRMGNFSYPGCTTGFSLAGEAVLTCKNENVQAAKKNPIVEVKVVGPSSE